MSVAARETGVRDASPVARVVESVVRRPVLAVVAVAAVVRLTAALVVGLQPGYAIPDEEQYMLIATLVASGDSAADYNAGYGQRLYDTTYPFSATLAALVRAFGSHQIVGQLLAAAFGVVAAGLTAALALRAVRPAFAVLVGLLAALLPSQVLWSSVVLRESMVWSALVLLALALTEAARTRSARRLLVAGVAGAVALLALGLLREQTMVIAGIALVLAAPLVRARRPFTVSLAALALAAFVPVAVGWGPFGIVVVEKYAPQLATVRLKLSIGADSSFIARTERPDPTSEAPARDPRSAAGDQQSGVGSDPSGSGGDGERGDDAEAPNDAVAADRPTVAARDGRRYEVDNSAAGILSTAPRGLVAVALRPFPWESARSRGVLLAKFENIGWVLLYVVAAVGTWAGRRRLDVIAFPVLLTLGVLAAASISQANLGTAFRHRGQVLWALAVLAGLGACMLYDKWRGGAAKAHA